MFANVSSLLRPNFRNVVYVSKSVNVYYNLQVEEYLLNHTPNDQRCLLFYTNTDSVVIGRNQSYFLEVNFPSLKDTVVARRYSGGGTVFHDLGNVNYSLITDKRLFNKQYLAESVARPFKLHVNIRHDLVNNRGEKVSGSAFRILREKALHHGTMLLATDLVKLHFMLQSPAKPTDKVPVPSVRSSVANLGIKPCDFIEKVIEQVFPHGDYCVIDVPDNLTDINLDMISSDEYVHLSGPAHEFTFNGQIFKLKDGKLFNESEGGVPCSCVPLSR